MSQACLAQPLSLHKRMQHIKQVQPADFVQGGSFDTDQATCQAGFSTALTPQGSRRRTKNSPAEPLPAEADGCPELLLALSGGGIVKRQLFACRNVSQGVDRNGQPPSAGHDHSLAVGVAAMAHAAGQGTLQIHKLGSLCMRSVQQMHAALLLICTTSFQLCSLSPTRARCGTGVLSQLCHCYAGAKHKPATWADSRAPELNFWAASMNRTS